MYFLEMLFCQVSGLFKEKNFFFFLYKIVQLEEPLGIIWCNPLLLQMKKLRLREANTLLMASQCTVRAHTCTAPSQCRRSLVPMSQMNTGSHDTKLPLTVGGAFLDPWFPKSAPHLGCPTAWRKRHTGRRPCTLPPTGPTTGAMRPFKRKELKDGRRTWCARLTAQHCSRTSRQLSSPFI